MTVSEYQALAGRTINRELSTVELTRHALHGLSAEVGEIHSLYQKRYQGHDFKADDLKKEIGDAAWFLAEFCTANGWSMEEVFRMNIEKLKRRYPEGFDPEKSVNRSE